MADGFGSDSYSYGDGGYGYGNDGPVGLNNFSYSGVSGPFETGSFGEGGSFGDGDFLNSGPSFGNDSLNYNPPVNQDAPVEDPNSFLSRAKRVLLGQGANMAGNAAGLPGPVSSGLLAAAQAPEGRRMNAGGDAMGRSVVNGIVGAIPGVGLVNTISGLLGGPTVGGMMPRGASSGMGYGESTGRGGAGGSVLGGLAALYGYNQASKGLNSQINGLQGLYGQNSPYAQTLRQQLERKDAAAGRRSQYGPREVELQARLAQLASGQSGMLNQLQNQRTQMRTQGLGQLLQFGRQSGLFDRMQGGLTGMFNSGASNYNDFSNPDDFWLRGSSGD